MYSPFLYHFFFFFFNDTATTEIYTLSLHDALPIYIVTNNRGDYPSLLRNDDGNASHWLTILLIGTKSNRDGTGASLKLTAQGIVQVEQAKGGMGYMSASDPRIHFGLGERTRIESLEITWPSGLVQKLTDVPADQIITVKEGVGIMPRKFPRIASPK